MEAFGLVLQTGLEGPSGGFSRDWSDHQGPENGSRAEVALCFHGAFLGPKNGCGYLAIMVFTPKNPGPRTGKVLRVRTPSFRCRVRPLPWRVPRIVRDSSFQALEANGRCLGL